MPRGAKAGCRILKRVAGWCPAESPRKSSLSLGGSAAVTGAARSSRESSANRMGTSEQCGHPRAEMKSRYSPSCLRSLRQSDQNLNSAIQRFIGRGVAHAEVRVLRAERAAGNDEQVVPNR